MKKTNWKKLFTICLLLTGAILLFKYAQGYSLDFLVYWTSARSWLEGKSPYDLVVEVRGFVIKYPPWVLPVFFPLGLVPFWIARTLWAIIELFCIYYTVRWLIQKGVRISTALWVAAGFWWMFAAHFYSGQIFLPIMVACLWALDESPKKSFRKSVAILALSSKIFMGTTLIGIWRKIWNLRTIGFTLFGFVLGHLIVLARFPGNLLDLYKAWHAAAISSPTDLGLNIFRGQGNHGFVAGILRHTSLDPYQPKYDIIVWLLLSIVLGTIWFRASKKMQEAEKWVGWIALGGIVHTLAWHHSYVLAYPLCAISLDRAQRTKKRFLVYLAWLAIAMIGLLIPQTIGPVWVKPLELWSVKSWGVCLAAWVLWRAKK